MAQTLAREISEEIENAVKSALRRLTAEAENAQHIAEDLAHEAATRGRRMSRIAVREIKHHPVSSIAVGVAIGAIATLLLTRRD